MFKSYETELAGRKLTIETGKIAKQANGSVVVRYGDTVVMTNVTAAKEPKDDVDFFPLSVDYEEKLYAAGRIPGSFNRRDRTGRRESSFRVGKISIFSGRSEQDVRKFKDTGIRSR